MTSGVVVGRNQDVSKALPSGGKDYIGFIGRTSSGELLSEGTKLPKHARRKDFIGMTGNTNRGTVVSRGKVGKGMLSQSVAPRLARKRPVAGTNGRRFVTGDQNSLRVVGKADVSKLSFGGGMKQFKAFSGGAKAGYAGVKPSAVLPSSRTAGFEGAVKSGEKFGLGAFKHRKPIAYGAGGTAAAGGMYALSKRHGDPEDARYARLGAASAASGIAAAELSRRAVVGPLRTRRALGEKKVRDSLKSKAEIPGTTPKAKAILQGLSSKHPGVIVGPRSALYGAGALLAGGTAIKTGRAASERRWN